MGVFSNLISRQEPLFSPLFSLSFWNFKIASRLAWLVGITKSVSNIAAFGFKAFLMALSMSKYANLIHAL
ncbi:hypothetical protein Kazakh3189_12280 [Helicobacter pylori]